MTETELLQQRIDRLERRWRGALILILAVGAVALLGARSSPKVVDASAFVLVNEAGDSRAQLALAKDGGVNLLLTSPDQKSDAGMTVLADGSIALRLRTPKRTSTWEIAADGTARLRFNQARSKAAVEFGIDAEGRPRLYMNDGFGKVVHRAP